MMSKGLRMLAAVAVIAAAAAGSGPAWAETKTPCSPSGTSLALTAEHHKFDKDCLAVTAGESFTIRFDNRDSDRHNVAVLPSHTSTETLFAGDILPGPKSTVYAVPKLKAGTYHFHCEVHPNLMNGTFVVAAAAPAPAPAAGGASTPPPMTADGSKPKSAAAAPLAAAPAPAPAPTPAPKSPAATATDRRPAAADAAVAGTKLPRTGPAADRVLLLLAGLALAAGGLSVLAGAQKKA